MKRSYLHLLIDVLMLLGAVGLILTGLLLAFILPAGSHHDSVWEMTRHEWGDVHFWIAMGIIGIALLHVTLNWGWICSVIAKMLGVKSTKPTMKRKLWTGIISASVLAVLVGGFLFAAKTGKITDPQGLGRGGGQGHGQLENALEDLFLDDPASR
jgi:Domain of unknown function (DUF4405)